MITSSSADFTTEEARLRGALPFCKVTISPYPHKPGLDGTGTFVNTSYVSLAEILATYAGFAAGSWVSAALPANLGYYPSPAVFTWDWNAPGFDLVVSWRSAATTAALAVTSWTAISSGDTVNLNAYCQWKIELTGYRAWVVDDPGDADDWTVYAVDAPGGAYDSFPADTNHLGDSETYVKTPEILGVYPVPSSDIVQAGTFTEEVPEGFGLVAGDHTGLVFNNRHGHYNELRSDFIFSHVPDWWDQEYQILLEAGYKRRDTGELLTVPVYQGVLADFGPANHALGEPHDIEVYSISLMSCLMESLIGYDSAGKPWPFFYGSYLAEAKKIIGKTLDPPLRTIDFEDGNFNEVDHLIVSGGGALSIVSTSPLQGSYSTQAATTGANQSAVMQFDSPVPGTTMMLQFPMKFLSMPATIVEDNFYFLRILDTNGVQQLKLTVDSDGNIKYWSSETSSWNIIATPGQREISLRFGATKLQIWQDGNEVLNVDSTPGVSLKTLEIGASTGATAESWAVIFDNIRIGNTYYDNCFQVDGYPFDSIDIVYLDDLPQKTYVASPPSGTIVATYPEYGAVVLRDTTDITKDVSGAVKFKLTANTISHPIDQIEDLLTLAGGADYINAASFAAAKALIPDYSTGCRFDGGSKAGDCLTAITQACLISVHMGIDIKATPYLGTVPPAPSPLVAKVNQLGSDELREVKTTVKKSDLSTRIGKKQLVKGRVTILWGNHDRQPDLSYTAGDPAADGEDMDLTYGSPVATENQEMAKALADLKLICIGPKRLWGPVRLSHRGLRLEGMDSVQVNESFLMDAAMNFRVRKKEVTFDIPRETILEIDNRLREI